MTQQLNKARGGTGGKRRGGKCRRRGRGRMMPSGGRSRKTPLLFYINIAIRLSPDEAIPLSGGGSAAKVRRTRRLSPVFAAAATFSKAATRPHGSIREEGRVVTTCTPEEGHS